ncbi:MAG TPA: alpha/beta fold hydrolase [Candidatus Dormibacteraeota bacterium]|nr:alpha/beta fold hydrolase [Candidatus Dormibacteraeota bacterium]
MSKVFSPQDFEEAVESGEVLARADSLGLLGALAKVAVRSRNAPRRMADLGVELGKITVGRSGVRPEPKDWRFANRAWSENPAFRRLAQGYLAWAQVVDRIVADADLDWRTTERAQFATRLMTSALSPTNFLPLNPDALERAWETGGKSLLRGLRNIGRDIRHNSGVPRSVKPGAFTVGKNLAVTPGAVVYRNEVCELIQYSPQTPAVYSLPVVLIPPQINKFYFMDMAPGRSLVEYAVRQGFQVFVVSWRNPTAEHHDWDLDKYAGAAIEALRAAQEITGSDRVNTIALCAGGITTAAVIGHLAAIGDPLVHSATFAVTLLDFSEPTMIGMFGSASVVRNAIRSSERAGVLDGNATRLLFALLRPNELLWNYWVSNNLLGEDPPTFDVLAWNADSTRLPASLHADFLDIFRNDSFSAGTLKTLGTTVELAQVKCDNFVVAASNDHLTAWRACYSTTRLLGGPSEFTLSSSGHIQSLVNPPGNPKMTYASGPATGTGPDKWLAGAVQHQGSWWERWAGWLAPRSGDQRAPATGLGSKEHPPIEPAPGLYVMER